MYEISKEQADFIYKVLIEFPAKHTIQSIDILRNLKSLPLKKEDEQDNWKIKK